MSKQSNRPRLHTWLGIPVILIILAAFILSSLAVVENFHFLRTAERIFGLVGMVRTAAAAQKSFAAAPGEDVWEDLLHVGRIGEGYVHTNAWGGDIRAFTTAGGMRIETDLPARDCRRLAVYFLSYQAADIGLISIESKIPGMASWMSIYPPSAAHRASQMPEIACPGNGSGDLALVFRVR